MKRTFVVERLFSLGNYKNVKFMASVEVDESDERTAEEIFNELTDDVYGTFFEHSRRIARLNAVPEDKREEAFFGGGE